jgi:circadian clock protein KaiB
MKKPPEKSSAASKRSVGGAGRLERAGSLACKTRYVLQLYIGGSNTKSARAVESIKQFCEQHLQNRYDLEIIDIFQQPNLARTAQIVAAPTLIKRLPLPLRRLIGDLSSQEVVFLALDLRARE